MDTTLIIGMSVILAAVGVSCYMVLKSKKIIEEISKRNLKQLRVIKKELKL